VKKIYNQEPIGADVIKGLLSVLMLSYRRIAKRTW